MFFYWKRWIALFLKLYFTGNALLWLIFLFEILSTRSLPLVDSFWLSFWSLGNAQVILLMVFGGLAGALIIADWKEQGYFLYLYSLGLSSKRLIGWFMVPLFFVFVLLLMEIHIVRPYLSERISSYAINNVPVGQPFSIDNTVFFFPEQRLGQFFHVELVHNAVHIKALSGRIEQGSFELQSGSGIADSVSFDFGAMVVPFPVVKTAKSLHQRTAIELLDNGGRRERMELIKRFTIPFCFLLFFSAININVLQKGKPVTHVFGVMLIWWLLMRILETSSMSHVFAVIPMILSGLFFAFCWKRVI